MVPALTSEKTKKKKRVQSFIAIPFALMFLLAALCCVLFAMHAAAAATVPEAPLISVLGQPCGPSEGRALTETLWGWGEKETLFSGSSYDLGVFGERTAPLELAGEANEGSVKPLTADRDFATVSASSPSYISIDLAKDGETLLSGATRSEYSAFEYKENGRYDMTVDLTYYACDEWDETSYRYMISFELEPEPFAAISANEAAQGSILTLRLEKAFYKDEPVIETDLGDAIFIEEEDGACLSVIPVWYAQNPGDYEVKVSLGEWTHSETVSVTRTQYGRQDLTVSSSTVASTRGAAGANEDYAEKIKPTYAMADPMQYWEGLFIRPVEGRVTTQFGLYRYTNGSSTPTRHTGIDLAIAKGTPVPASNSGRVLYAGPVIISGNTVVIEHGGGLKTYYMHLDSIDVKEGDMVTKGDIIGKVGTTGYSTGPHLHFEVKIGSMSLDPWPLFDGTSGLYFFDDK